jgi:Cu+-exporting ATPase
MVLLADAIVSHFSKNAKEVTITDFKDIVGKGIKASYKNINVLVGTHSFMKDEHINISSQIEEKANDLRKVGKTVSFVAVNRDVIGLVALADTLKKESFETIQKLKQMGIRTIMMTGDNKITAQTIGDELQIDEVIAEVMPQDKASKVKEVQTEGVKRMIVGMVGDGINDAPAMAQSDIGIAMGTGTDVAVATGDIVIVGGSIEKVLESIDLSRKTLQIIKQNLFWAFLYNIIGIPVAAGILYPFMSILLSPILASLAMALSSVSVVGNSLRLKYLT